VDCLISSTFFGIVSIKDTLLSPRHNPYSDQTSEGSRVADDLKLKGPVREIGIIRDHDRHDSFNITIGITIKTEGKVTYEEAERLSSKFRREYLGKDVEFRSVSIPCPVCGKIMNSESGLKKHVAMNHPEQVDLVNPPKAAAKVEKPEKKTRVKKAEKPAKPAKKRRAGKRKANASKKVKAEKPKAIAAKKPRAAKEKPAAVKVSPPPVETIKPVKPRVKAESPKPAPVLREPAKTPSSKAPQKTRQLTLA
jgi:hypothetical protein